MKTFSPFPTMFSTLSQTENIIGTMIILALANAFNFVESKKLWFGKELTHYLTTNFRLFQTERVCR